MSVIANTAVISNFVSIGQLDLLRQLCGVLYISTEVYEEIQAGIGEGYQCYMGIHHIINLLVQDGWMHWMQLTGLADEKEIRLFGQLPSRLHSGEASCLAIPRYRGWIFLTADQAARPEATRLEIPVSGSGGCLGLAVERGLCPLRQANIWLGEMIKLDYRSPLTDLTPLPKR